jgi:hypothetical protein
MLTGIACDDGNGCTQTDTCQMGICTGTDLIADGAGCDDGDLCTQTDTCQLGICTGADPAIDGTVCDDGNPCTDTDTCEAGICVGALSADGTPRDVGNACSQADTCQVGVCTPASPVICHASGECYGAGTCDPETGTCGPSIEADGASCWSGTCQDGTCIPTLPDIGVVGCGCKVSGSRAGSGFWLGLVLLLTVRRSRSVRREDAFDRERHPEGERAADLDFPLHRVRHRLAQRIRGERGHVLPAERHGDAQVERLAGGQVNRLRGRLFTAQAHHSPARPACRTA